MSADRLRVEVCDTGDATIVRVVGDVGGLLAEQELHDALSSCVALAAPGALVVVDLSQASGFTNDACGELATACIKAMKSQVRFCLAAVPQEAFRRLKTRGLDRIIPVYESVAAAQDGASA